MLVHNDDFINRTWLYHESEMINDYIIFWAGLNIILMLGLDVVLDDVVSRALLSPVANDDGWAANDLPGFALGVQLAKAGPLTQLLVGVYLDDGDLKTTNKTKKLDSMFSFLQIPFIHLKLGLRFP
jgi:hypothetical protein